ncbi:sulfur carrier protein ThiS [Pseudonocardia sp. N23]|uniref:sulfur carrier protein ThiS n=1 Tax=Pseudonocardia sp. N23 TaxID=1987376 RepID=UPI000BFE8CAC|nr:sulfur carrier protein ThiS [Pseudonocardia sp. N23]GAY09069.1 sulfur carrier protein ThiS [Pseudonocardia sp. N23]
MTVWINGAEHELGPGASVLDALDAMGAPRAGVAVAVDAEVVPRAAWASTALVDGSRVEVLTAVQGG